MDDGSRNDGLVLAEAEFAKANALGDGDEGMLEGVRIEGEATK